MSTCFSIMPFNARFIEVDRVISEAAVECGLEYVRSDRHHQPGSVMPQVVKAIRESAVVVADITDYNPNVLYELGIAHQIKGPDRVVIVTQALNDKAAYDLQQFRQLLYEQHADGLRELRDTLPGFLRAAMRSTVEQETWSVIRGRLPRTRMIVRDLEHVLDSAGPAGRVDLTIRTAAGLGTMAISDLEPVDPSIEPEYRTSLLSERNLLRELLVRGARLKAVLNPPRRFAQKMLPARLKVRYERLIGLLEGRSDVSNPELAALDLAAMSQCEFVVSPVPMPNLFVIGDMVAYEGFKRGGAHGFDKTHCFTGGEDIREVTEQFDQFYDDARREMRDLHPPSGLSGNALLELLRRFYQEALSGESASV